MSRSMCTKASHGSGIRRWLVALMLLSLLGMADSGYLLLKYRRSTLLTTGTGGSSFCQAGGCDLVSQGEYAVVRGIPLAGLGLVGYLALLALTLMAAALCGRSLMWGIVGISGIGVVVSAFLVFPFGFYDDVDLYPERSIGSQNAASGLVGTGRAKGSHITALLGLGAISHLVA